MFAQIKLCEKLSFFSGSNFGLIPIWSFQSLIGSRIHTMRVDRRYLLLLHKNKLILSSKMQPTDVWKHYHCKFNMPCGIYALFVTTYTASICLAIITSDLNCLRLTIIKWKKDLDNEKIAKTSMMKQYINFQVLVDVAGKLLN